MAGNFGRHIFLFLSSNVKSLIYLLIVTIFFYSELKAQILSFEDTL